MSAHLLYHDFERCIGCRACEIHCKTNKNLGPGPALCLVMTLGPEIVDTKVRVRFVFLACFHCEQPWCAKACPAGALSQRAADGLVLLDPSRCAGCKACVLACPFGAMQWDPVARTAVKCDYCVDRLDRGLAPACVSKCVTGCLSLIDAAHPPEDRRQSVARALGL